ncbi:MAG TPA: hypothetical protein VGK96_01575, partial [Candidatus Sulfotelmatobacter sp.]
MIGPFSRIDAATPNWCGNVGKKETHANEHQEANDALLAGIFCLGCAALAQETASAPAWSPSKDIGVFVFGKNGQSADQQLKDESECYGSAK